MIKKVFLTLFIFIMIFSIYPSWSHAIGNIQLDADDFLNVSEANIINETIMQRAVSDLYNIFLTIGVIIAVVVAAILGIQFMTGSVEAQAKVKEKLIPFVIGCVILFGAFGIWKLIVTIGNNFLG